MRTNNVGSSWLTSNYEAAQHPNDGILNESATANLLREKKEDSHGKASKSGVDKTNGV